MEIDRETPEEPTEVRGSPPQQGPGSAAQEYGYGAPADPAPSDPSSFSEREAGPVTAESDESGALERSGAPEESGAPDESGAPEAGSAGEDTGVQPATGMQPVTALREGTAPRAVLRPVPEGFPTPPPRPARPNRRPAPSPAPGDAAPGGPRRGPLIASLAVVAVLVLVVAVGGSILAYRALAPETPAAPAASDADPADPAPGGASATGEVAIGDVTVRELGTEVGVRQVGDRAETVEPDGEFVIVTFEIVNASTQALYLVDNAALQTADGTVVPVDEEASREYVADTDALGLVGPEQRATMHAVYDVPVGAEPAGVQFDLSMNTDAGTGTLPLGG